MSNVAILTNRRVSQERDVFITADGEEYILSAGNNRSVLYDTGTGMPEIEYVSQRGPYQHGDSLKDYFLRPRVLEMRLRQNFKNRQEYWDGRAALINILRPNRGLTSVLRKVLPDGAKRDLQVVVQHGPRFEPRKLNEWDEYSLDETIRFIAHNPVYYSPDQRSQSFSPVGAFTFPITFPIVFTEFGNTITIDYVGTWIEYPRIVITGPLTATSIYNTTTDENLGFSYNILDGRVVTFDLSHSVKRVLLDDGTNLTGYLSGDSDLATFHLAPGSNTVQVLGTGAGGNTSIIMSWYDRFVGI